MRKTPENYDCNALLMDELLIEALEAWKLFICYNEQLSSFDTLSVDIIDTFKLVKTVFKNIALSCGAITHSSHNLDDSAFIKTIEHIERKSHDFQTLYTSIKDLRSIEIFESVNFIFTQYSKSITLPYKNPDELDFFSKWKPDFRNTHDNFIQKMQASCCCTENAVAIYEQAALTDFEPLESFLSDYPEITEFCFNHIKIFKKLDKYYQEFCTEKKEAARYFSNYRFFCNAVEAVVSCFLRNKEFVALPHTNINQFEQFKRWDRSISKILEDFNKQIQNECLTTTEIRLTYVDAVTGKITLDPTAPTAYQALINNHTRPLQKFLRRHPSITKFFYDHIITIEALAKYYRIFLDKQSPKFAKDIFEDPDCFNLLKQLTHKDFIEKLGIESSIENSYTTRIYFNHQKRLLWIIRSRMRYPFATHCLHLLDSVMKEKGSNQHNCEVEWKELYDIIHSTYDSVEEQHKAMLAYLEKNPQIAHFFDKERNSFIELSRVFDAQCNMISKKIKTNKSGLFNGYCQDTDPEENNENSYATCSNAP